MQTRINKEELTMALVKFVLLAIIFLAGFALCYIESKFGY